MFPVIPLTAPGHSTGPWLQRVHHLASWGIRPPFRVEMKSLPRSKETVASPDSGGSSPHIYMPRIHRRPGINTTTRNRGVGSPNIQSQIVTLQRLPAQSPRRSTPVATSPPAIRRLKRGFTLPVTPLCVALGRRGAVIWHLRPLVLLLHLHLMRQSLWDPLQTLGLLSLEVLHLLLPSHGSPLATLHMTHTLLVVTQSPSRHRPPGI